MMRGSSRSRTSRVGFFLVGVIVLGVAYGCSAVLGLGDYSVGAADSGTQADANSPTDGAADASCDVDLTVECYACTPENTDEFLNSCTDGTCIPFDQSRITGLLLADGGLPPLPPPDAGDGG